MTPHGIKGNQVSTASGMVPIAMMVTVVTETGSQRGSHIIPSRCSDQTSLAVENPRTRSGSSPISDLCF